MKGLIKLSCVAALMLTAAGCSSINGIPMDTPVTPKAFDSAYSKAFNIANQTDLTRDFEYAGRTYYTPLRDFTEEEVSEQKSYFMQKNNGANASYLIGGLRVLSGDLGGAFSIATGGVASLSSGDDPHPARLSRWIVSVPAKNYGSEEEAKASIKKNILDTIIKEIEAYGVSVTAEINEDSRKYAFERYYAITSDGKKIDLNMRNQTDVLHTNVEPVIHQQVDFGEGSFDAYSVGLRGLQSKSKIVFAMNHALFLEKDVVGDDTFSDFMIRVSKKLPENYYFYETSYPKFIVGDKVQTYTDINVPSIYNRGVKYDFIEVKE